jgi:hypothetical protein
LITWIIIGDEYRSLSSSLCSLLHSPVASSFLAQISSSAPYSRTPSVFVPLSVWENQVSHPYKTTGKTNINN